MPSWSISLRHRYYAMHLLREYKRYGLPDSLTRSQITALAVRGFSPREAALYGFKGHPLPGYLSTRDRLDLQRLARPPADLLLEDKLLFQMLGSQLGLRMPGLRGLLVKGIVVPFPLQDQSRPQPVRLQDLLAEGDLVIRPTKGGNKVDVKVLQLREQQLYCNGRPIDGRDLERRLATVPYALVTAYVEHAQYAAQIAPGFSNTIRVLTVQGTDGRARVAAAVHNFHADEDWPFGRPVDDRLRAPINPDTGKLGMAVQTDGGGFTARHDAHPLSLTPITGVQIPHWNELCGQLCKANERLPGILHVSWDVLVGEDGPWIIEGESTFALPLFQRFGPLLMESPFFDYARRYGFPKDRS